MSIVGMANVSTLKTAARSDIDVANPAQGGQVHDSTGKEITGVPSGTLDSLIVWIPTETVGAYIAALAIVGAPQTPKGGDLSSASFTSEWILVVAGVLLTWLGILAAKAQKSADAMPTPVPFKIPSFELVAGTVAFLLWSLALPQSPMFAWSSWDEKWGALAVIFGTPIITAAASLLQQDQPTSTS